MANPGTFWTKEKLDKVRELAPLMSASMIAAEVGAPTRQAVIGICYRHGIPLTGGAVSHRPRGGPRGPRTVHAARETGTVPDINRKSLQRVDRIVKTAEDIKRNVAELQKPPEPFKTFDGFVRLFDLLDHHCRSVQGYEGSIAFFCGQPKAHGTAWCDHHARRFIPGLFGLKHNI